MKRPLDVPTPLAVGTSPVRLDGFDKVRGRARYLDDLVFPGQLWGRTVADEVSALARKQCHPLTNINVDPEWRREVLPVYVRRAFEAAGAL